MKYDCKFLLVPIPERKRLPSISSVLNTPYRDQVCRVAPFTVRDCLKAFCEEEILTGNY